MVAGVAPGGHVSVWVSGIDKRIEIFCDQLTVADIPWKDFLDNPNIDRHSYVESELKDSLNDQELSSIKNKNIPFGIWHLAGVFEALLLEAVNYRRK